MERRTKLGVMAGAAAMAFLWVVFLALSYFPHVSNRVVDLMSPIWKVLYMVGVIIGAGMEVAGFSSHHPFSYPAFAIIGLALLAALGGVFGGLLVNILGRFCGHDAI